jgi:hypothetical protein
MQYSDACRVLGRPSFPVRLATSAPGLVALAVAIAALAACAPVASDPSTGAATSTVAPLEPGVPAATTTTLAEPDPPLGEWYEPGERQGLGGCPLFPTDHVYRARVRGLPVQSGSPELIGATGGGAVSLVPGFSAGIWEGSRAGIPFNVVDGSTARRVDFVVTYNYHDDASHLGVPVPQNPRYEGWPIRAWDRHLVVVDTSTCQTREVIGVRTPEDDLWGFGGGRWYADAAATFDLHSNGASSGVATASMVSLLSGLVRFDEVAGGEIDHALSVTLNRIAAGAVTWPAMATDGRSTEPHSIPMGSWLRLRDDVGLNELGPQARVIAEALKEHGMIVTDTGPGLILQGDPDTRWDDADLRTLRSLSLADFELLDASALMVSPRSFQMRTR